MKKQSSHFLNYKIFESLLLMELIIEFKDFFLRLPGRF